VYFRLSQGEENCMKGTTKVKLSSSARSSSEHEVSE
jgi:hypothetical protein